MSPRIFLRNCGVHARIVFSGASAATWVREMWCGLPAGRGSRSDPTLLLAMRGIYTAEMAEATRKIANGLRPFLR